MRPKIKINFLCRNFRFSFLFLIVKNWFFNVGFVFEKIIIIVSLGERELIEDFVHIVAAMEAPLNGSAVDLHVRIAVR